MTHAPMKKLRLYSLLLSTLSAFLISCGGGDAKSEGSDQEDTTGTAARTDSLRQAAIADSLRDGYHVYKDEADRPLMEGTMLGGQRHGVWTSYLPSGRVHSRNVYDHGVLNGITTVFHENGVLYYSGTQRRGKPFGEWKFYDTQGILANTALYDTSGAIIPDKRDQPDPSGSKP